jgi:hypothetical protein
VDNLFNYFKIKVFLAALPRELCGIVAQQDQKSLTSDNMYDIATTQQRKGTDNKLILASNSMPE